MGQPSGEDLGGEEVFYADREFADADSGGVVDGGGEGWGYAGEADLADASGSVLAHHGVGDVEEVDVDLGGVSAEVATR